MTQELAERDFFRGHCVYEREAAVVVRNRSVEIDNPFLDEGHHRRRRRYLKRRAGTKRASRIVLQDNVALDHHNRGKGRNAARPLHEIGKCFAGALINRCHSRRKIGA